MKESGPQRFWGRQSIDVRTFRLRKLHDREDLMCMVIVTWGVALHPFRRCRTFSQKVIKATGESKRIVQDKIN
ncbi:hypothetical protein [Paraburkholderia sp. MM5482-R1]|uniref:hypothetical protein n=1 Tax=unclassified Paraburkholderia TaxID=2615204 RepID=UPI003D217C6C